MPTYSEDEYKRLLRQMEPEQRAETLRINDQEASNEDADQGSKLEKMFAEQIAGLGIVPPPVREYLFHGLRNWRFDFCWVDQMIAVEIEGGTRLRTAGGSSAGHAHPDRYESDCEKYNEAAINGWLLLRFTGDMVRSGKARETLLRAFVVALQGDGD